jgi:hypothetical protein
MAPTRAAKKPAEPKPTALPRAPPLLLPVGLEVGEEILVKLTPARDSVGFVGVEEVVTEEVVIEEVVVEEVVVVRVRVIGMWEEEEPGGPEEVRQEASANGRWV